VWWWKKKFGLHEGVKKKNRMTHTSLDCNKGRRRDHFPQGKDVFICKKQDKRCSSAKKEKMCPCSNKKKEMCSCAKRSRCVPLQAKKAKRCSSANFRLLQSFRTVKTSQASCWNSSTAHQCHGTQAISKRHHLVVIELHTTALGPRTQTQPMSNGA
jgi:hypothetical protein